MRFFQWLLAGLTIAGLLYIISLNPHMAEFKWTPNSEVTPAQVPLYSFIIVTFVAGYLVGLFYYWLGSISKVIKTSAEIRTLKKTVKQLEEQLYGEETDPRIED